MYKVIDNSFSRDERLREYFVKSQHNYAVITDYLAMELFKNDPLEYLSHGMRIICSFPKQVIVLKDTQTICGLRGRRAGLRRRMVDEEETKKLEGFCSFLRQTESGDLRSSMQISEKGRSADEHINGTMLIGVEGLPNIIKEMRDDLFTQEEVNILIRKEPLSEAMVKKVVDESFLLYARLCVMHSNVAALHKAEEVINTFIYRKALLIYIYAIEFIRDGTPLNKSSERLRNDMVDLHYVVYASFFDGLLTDDKRQRKIYNEFYPIIDSVTEGM